LEKISKNKLRYFKSFLLKKNRKREEKFLVEGGKCIEEALRSPYNITAILYFMGLGKTFSSIIEKAQSKNIIVYKGTEKNLRECSDASSPQGIIAIAEERKLKIETLLNDNEQVLLLLDAVSDPGNLGTLLRTADWFGVNGIILGENSCELYSPKVVRSAMGSLFHVSVIEQVVLTDVIDRLKESGFTVFAADIRGKTSFNFKEKRIALILGNESRGVSTGLLKRTKNIISVPGEGSCDSLNVAVSGGILLWEIFKTVKLKSLH